MTNFKQQNIINKIQSGGISVKDNPDKLDKNDFESNKRDEDEMIEEDEDEEEAVVEEEVAEEEVSEEETEEEKEEKEEKEEEHEEVGEGGDEDEGCLYQITKKKTNIEIELDAGEDNFEDEDTDKNKQKSIYVKSDERVTKPFLFEFERVRILGERARQLSLGAKPMLKNIDNFDPKLIAKMELEQKVIPLIILRELPDGRIEKWKVNELSY